MSSDRARLLAFYDIFPFERHPLWVAVSNGSLSIEQILRAETQHYLRTKEGQGLREQALQSAKNSSERIHELLLETYIEECLGTEQEPNHLELIRNLLLLGGVTEPELKTAFPTIGNSLAIAMYREIGRRGPGCHMLAAGAVEYFYSKLCPTIFEAYTSLYGMTDEQARTYRIHGPMDEDHAERAFAVLDEAVRLHGWKTVEISVRDAFAATSLHYDGMLEGATGINSFWNGRDS